jgi:hypothetical protein
MRSRVGMNKINIGGQSRHWYVSVFKDHHE